jgi:hypothetical protein
MKRSSESRSYPAMRRELRFSVRYADFTRALDSLLARLSSDLLADISTETPEIARERLAALVGPSGFALFQKIDHGALLKTLTDRHVKAMTYVFGNLLITIDITKHVTMAGLYLPLRLYVCEFEGGIRVSYDVPSVTLAQFRSPRVNAVADSLDVKVVKLIDVAAALALRAGATQRTPSTFSLEAGGRR